MWSALAKPELARIHGGRRGFSAFDFATGEKLWTKTRASVDPSLRSSANAPGYRDLELDGLTIWAACVCDAVDGGPAKALVKLDAEGNHDPSWLAEAGPRRSASR